MPLDFYDQDEFECVLFEQCADVVQNLRRIIIGDVHVAVVYNCQAGLVFPN